MEKKVAIRAGFVSLVVAGMSFVSSNCAFADPVFQPQVKTMATPSCGEGSYVSVPNMRARQSAEGLSTALGIPDVPQLNRLVGEHVNWVDGASCRVVKRSHPMVKSKRMKSSNYTSGNWSGYVTSSAVNPNYVQGQWKVPNVSFSFDHGDLANYLSTWVGLGGYGNHNLVQNGVGQDIECNLYRALLNCGTSTYFWYEALPANEMQLTNFRPNVGDTVWFFTSWASGTAHYLFCDETKNQCVLESNTSSQPGSTADWIVERTEVSKDFEHPLANFSSETFVNCVYRTGSNYRYAAAGGLKSIDMNEGNDILDNVSNISSNGANFTVTWKKPW